MRIGTLHSGFGRGAATCGRLASLWLGLLFGTWGALGWFGPSPAAAQGWFDTLFRPFQPQVLRPPLDQPMRSVRRPKPKPRPVVEKPPEKPVVPPSRFVAVIGDSLAQQLTQGLAEGLADRPDVGILRKARENTGLVRDDVFDWLKETRALLESGDRIDVAVMLIGSNDRQAIRRDGTSEELLSPRWKDIYAARVKAIASLFAEHHIPIVWVGLPIMKSDRFSADMSGFNDIYREQAEAAGATYVDIWEAFESETGHYSAFGPNMDGQIVRLRAADGVNFTRAGGRKLAHFVEADVRRLLDLTGAASPPQASTRGTEPPAAARDGAPRHPEAAPAPVPVAGPVLPLTGAPVAADGVLANAAAPAATQDAAAAALIERALVKGQPINAKPGRADDHRWLQP